MKVYLVSPVLLSTVPGLGKSFGTWLCTGDQDDEAWRESWPCYPAPPGALVEVMQGTAALAGHRDSV